MSKAKLSVAAPSASTCFHFAVCGRHATLEKSGKSLCRGCAQRYSGMEYPLRQPSREPLYASSHEARVALGFEDPRSIEEGPGSRRRPRARQLQLGRESSHIENRFPTL